MNQSPQKGSALLLSVILLSGLTVVAMLAWRSTTYSYICATEKQKYLQERLSLQALQQYAIALCKTDMKNIYAHLEMNDHLILEFDHWPTIKSEDTAIIQFYNPTKKGAHYQITVCARLEQKYEKPCSLSCVICADKSRDSYALSVQDTRFT